MDRYADLKAALTRVEKFQHPDVICSWAYQAPSVRALLAERDALREALVMAEAMLCKQENELRSFGAHEPCAESAILTARAALAQEQGEKHDNKS